MNVAFEVFVVVVALYWAPPHFTKLALLEVDLRGCLALSKNKKAFLVLVWTLARESSIQKEGDVTQ